MRANELLCTVAQRDPTVHTGGHKLSHCPQWVKLCMQTLSQRLKPQQTRMHVWHDQQVDGARV